MRPPDHLQEAPSTPKATLRVPQPLPYPGAPALPFKLKLFKQRKSFAVDDPADPRAPSQLIQLAIQQRQALSELIRRQSQPP